MQDNINKDTEEKVTNEPKENIEEVNESSVVDDFFMEDIYKNNYIDLYKLEGLDIKDQSKIFTLLLTNIYKDYSDIDYGNIRKYSLKCLKLSCDPEENELKLPYKLLVTKDTNRMYFMKFYNTVINDVNVDGFEIRTSYFPYVLSKVVQIMKSHTKDKDIARANILSKTESKLQTAIDWLNSECTKRT